MWAEAARQSMEAVERLRKPIGQNVAAQHMLLVKRKDEKQQRELLEWLQGVGLDCKCLLS